MILEVMGRRAGWIALYAGVAGGGDVILIPEIPYNIRKVAEKIRERNKKGKRFSIVVVAEGAKPRGGSIVIQRKAADGSEPFRLGGIGFVMGEEIEKLTGIETRTVVMGHLQRGGPPSPFDRILGTRLGAKAVDLIVSGDFGYMVGVSGRRLVKVALSRVARGSRLVPVAHELIKTARSTGACFGDY
jgi:6-phosphofructokinase 1